MAVHIIRYSHVDDADADLTLTFTDRAVVDQVTDLMKLEGFTISDWEERCTTDDADPVYIKDMCAETLEEAEQYRRDEAVANS